MNDSDQGTTKVHTFAIKYAEDIVELINNFGIKFESVMAVHDVAILRIKDSFDGMSKMNKEEKKKFIENFLADIYYLEDEKIVKVKMRGVGRAKQ